MAGLVSTRSRAPTWRSALALGVVAAVFFMFTGELARIPWLVVVLSLIYVGFLLRREPLNKRHPRSKNEALREALFAFGFTSLVMFSLGNFGTPDSPYDPLRMSITMGLAWGVVSYRLARGYANNGWRLLVTLLAVVVPVTVLSVLASRFL